VRTDQIFVSIACIFMEENVQLQIDAEVPGGCKPFPKEMWEGIAAQRRGRFASNLVRNYCRQFIEEEGIPL
jgi:hypothetical protein